MQYSFQMTITVVITEDRVGDFSSAMSSSKILEKIAVVGVIVNFFLLYITLFNAIFKSLILWRAGHREHWSRLSVGALKDG